MVFLIVALMHPALDGSIEQPGVTYSSVPRIASIFHGMVQGNTGASTRTDRGAVEAGSSRVRLNPNTSLSYLVQQERRGVRHATMKPFYERRLGERLEDFSNA